MTATTIRPAPERTLIEPTDDVLRLLLVVQAALLTVSAIEAAVIGVVGGLGGALPAVMTAAAAGTVLAARRRPGRIRRLRWLNRFEYLILAFALVDTLLAIFLAERLLEPVGIITRIAVPVMVLRRTRPKIRRHKARRS